ncbi:MAG: nucleoside recognition domain-containing protein, partial [Oscillospiraceae bacterium]
DGIILLAFILGFPANEIVFPIIIMGYLSSGSIMEFDNLSALKELLLANGWTWITAVSVLLFSLFHWPCSTTLLTIKKETGSLKWTALSLFIPTAVGFIVCFVFAGAARLVQSLIL